MQTRFGWRKLYRDGEPAPADPSVPALVPVTVTAAQGGDASLAPHAADTIEIELSGRYRVRVGSDIDGNCVACSMFWSGDDSGTSTGWPAPLARPQPSLRISARRGRTSASDPGRAGACRHHRAGAFPLHRRRGDRGASRRAARLCPQRHRAADGRRIARARSATRRPRLGRLHGRLCDRFRVRRRSRAQHRAARARCGCVR
jgi:hypothetical protein